MQASDLRKRLALEIPTSDAQAMRVICTAFRALRDFLRDNVVTTGIAGRLLRVLFPGTAKGIAAVVELLDDYLAEQCLR